MIRVIGFSLYGPQAASHRVRLSQFQLGLGAAGIDLQIQSLLDNAYLQRSFSCRRPSLRGLLAAYGCRLQALSQADRFDLAIVYGDLLPFLPGWLEHQLLQIPFIYDCDDAFFLKYRSGRLRLLQPLLGAKADRLMTAAKAVTAGNTGLAAHALRFNSNVTVLPSVVDTDQFRPAAPPPVERSGPPFTVGWIGSPSTAPYLQLLVEPPAAAGPRTSRAAAGGGWPRAFHRRRGGDRGALEPGAGSAPDPAVRCGRDAAVRHPLDPWQMRLQTYPVHGLRHPCGGFPRGGER